MAGDTPQTSMMRAAVVGEQIDSREFIMAQGTTPKDVRHFPEEGTEIRRSNLSLSGKVPSRSIPINHAKERAMDMQYDQDAALAEYRDYVMFHRIASAKQRQSTAGPPSGARRVPALYADNLQSMLLQNDNFSLTQGVTLDTSSTHTITYDPAYAMLAGLQVIEAASNQDDDWGDSGEEPIFELEL